MILASAIVVVVEGVQGLAVLQHHVVGHVHHVVDGTLPRLQKPVLHPPGRRADPYSLNHACGVPGAQRGVDYLHVHQSFDRLAIFRIGEVRLPYRRARQRRNLPGDAQHGQAVRPVGRDIQVKDHVAQVLLQRPALRRVLRQDQDALVVGAKGQLALGADHARRLHAADPGRLQRLHVSRPGVDQARAHPGEGHLLPRGYVGSAAYDGQLLAFQADRRQPQAVRVGMWVNADHVSHKHVVPGAAHNLDAPNLCPGHSQPVGQLRRRQVNVYVLSEPGQRYFHSGLLTTGVGELKRLSELPLLTQAHQHGAQGLECAVKRVQDKSQNLQGYSP